MPAKRPKETRENHPVANPASNISYDLRNANRGTERGRALLSRSLQEAGAGRSILADKHGRIIAGNKTYEAWSALANGANVQVIETNGEQLVVVQRSDLDLDDPKGLARRLAYYDNRVGQLDLDWNAEEVLQDLNAGVDLSALWNEAELKELLGNLSTGNGGGITEEPPEPEIDRAEELRQKWGTEVGQIWQLGKHRVVCGDCLDDKVRLLLLETNLPDMIWADPPYGISIVAANGFVGGGEAYDIPFGGTKNRPRRGYVGGGQAYKDKHGVYPIQKKAKGLGTVGGSKPFGSQKVRGTDGASHTVAAGKYYPVEGDDTTQTAVAAATSLLSHYPNACHIWWGANYYANVLPPSSCWLVWDKDNTGNFADCELAWTNQARAARLFEHRWNGMLKASEQGQRRFHPTQKPVALSEWAFKLLGDENIIVYDPFLGSGISVLAAERLGENRQVFACEKVPEYVAVTLERWAQMTGGTPEKIAG